MKCQLLPLSIVCSIIKMMMEDDMIIHKYKNLQQGEMMCEMSEEI